ncbi:protein kinase domain-containing protein [Rhodopirellula sp. MGV]|uniref:protein kinase domain-containing protein n=1 Tax=Rhodopirellula sp. MGV TaxID=2023130 RepID=UPI000BC3CEE3|nr:protein kinase [Rhodopirellula sp. MGV]OYP28271.1 hypothetical protein CGZ80_25960 [Rhodopirellula sp. MGV]
MSTAQPALINSVSSFTLSAGPSSNGTPSVAADSGSADIVLSNWEPLPTELGGRDADCNAFVAVDLSTTRNYEIRILPWPDTHDWKRNLQNQLRLTRLVAGVSARQVAVWRLEESPPKLICELAEPLASFDATLTPEARIDLGASIVVAVEQALMGGLFHGAISPFSILRDHEGSICIDFFARFYSAESYAVPATAQADARATVSVIRQLLRPVIDDPAAAKLGGQRRGQLRRLLNSVDQDEDPLDTFDRWSQWFAASARVEPAEPQRLGDRNETPSVQDDVTCEVAINPISHHSDEDELLSDATGEVQVVIGQAPSVASDEKTGEIAINPAAVNHNIKPLPGIGERVARYRLDALLGEGGMGLVYRATDTTNETVVAIKLLRPTGNDIAQAVRRFKKEARLLAGLNNPYVTRLFDSGVDQGVHYIAIEYVDGTDLKRWMASLGTMTEELALRLAADIARGLVEAHDLGIVHRDIKPENVLLQSDLEDTLEPGRFQIKLTDFGIARAMQQTASMEVTRAGSLLGTPTYMAPEQFKGTDRISPAADVYSIGITLYAMLSGEPPFQSNDPMNLAAKHCFDAPPDIRKRNHSVSDSTATLLGRMLAKSPGERPGDAGQLVHEIERLLRGQVSEFEQHPRLPSQSQGKLWERVFRWDLQSQPSELWPHVSNTDRLNRAAGLQAVEYRTERDAEHGLRKFGNFRLAGLQIEWEEHPFEWIEGQRMGILREFQSGPFEWFLSLVELTPLPEGGTRLTHTVRILPRNALGRMVASIEAGWKGGRALNRIYRRIDLALQNEKHNPLFDPFEEPISLSQAVKRRVEQRLDQMIQLGIGVETATRLVDYVCNAAAQDLAQIRPVALADRLGLPSEEIVDACLVGTHCGLLQLRWDILCPSCRAPASATGILAEIEQHTHCEACDAAFRSDIASAIELVFQAHPEIRKIDNGQYCIGGPEHSPHVVTQLRLQPGERLEVNVELTKGDYLVRRSGVGNSEMLQVQTRSASSSVEVWSSQLGSGSALPIVRSGSITLIVYNDQACHEVVRLERTIRRSNVLTAAVASALPRFRELFPNQVLDRSGAITSDELTLLAVRIGSGEELYEQVGDAQAYAIIQRVMTAIEETVVAHEGATIKSLGETVLASFQDPGRALSAALAIEDRLQREELSDVALACGLHRGTLLVTTQNGRLDYFGTTARQVLALSQRVAQGIALTDSVFTDPAVQTLVQSLDRQPQHQTVDLPGGKNRLIQLFMKPIPFQSHA